MKTRKIRIQKIGSSTQVTMYPEGYPPETFPHKAEVFQYNKTYRVYAQNDVIIVEAISPTLEFLISDLEDDLEATNTDELLTAFAERFFFVETEATEGTDPETNHDNIRIIKEVLVENGVLTEQKIVDAINSFDFYTVNNKQLVIFHLVHVNEIYQYLVYKYLLVFKGKGNYGVGGIQLTIDDVDLVEKTKLNFSEIIALPNTQIINYGVITIPVYNWLNTRNQPILIQPQSDGYVIFQGQISGIQKNYLFLNVGGSYGFNHEYSSPSDFQLFGSDGNLSDAQQYYERYFTYSGGSTDIAVPLGLKVIDVIIDKSYHPEVDDNELVITPGHVIINFPGLITGSRIKIKGLI